MNNNFCQVKKRKKEKVTQKEKKEKKEKLFTNVNNFFQSLLFQKVNKEKKEKEKVTQKEKERKEIINQSLFGLSFKPF